MSKSFSVYLASLLALVFWWLARSGPAVADFAHLHWAGLLGITALYLFSHILRMFRLVLLTLDKRNKAFFFDFCSCANRLSKQLIALQAWRSAAAGRILS